MGRFELENIKNALEDVKIRWNGQYFILQKSCKLNAFKLEKDIKIKIQTRNKTSTMTKPVKFCKINKSAPLVTRLTTYTQGHIKY